MDNFDVEEARARLLHHTLQRGLRQVAREVGMSPTGLNNFLEGAHPYRTTTGKMRTWIQRYSTSDADAEHGELVEQLVQALPNHSRDEARREVHAVLAKYVGASDRASQGSTRAE